MRPDAVDELHSPDALLRLLPEVDFVVLACPLTHETRGVVGARALEAMRRGAFLVNVARGGCVDEAALVAALRAGEIAGAGIDVTADEPLSPDSPLWGLENVVLTPPHRGRDAPLRGQRHRHSSREPRPAVAGEEELRNGIV